MDDSRMDTQTTFATKSAGKGTGSRLDVDYGIGSSVVAGSNLLRTGIWGQDPVAIPEESQRVEQLVLRLNILLQSFGFGEEYAGFARRPRLVQGSAAVLRFFHSPERIPAPVSAVSQVSKGMG